MVLIVSYNIRKAIAADRRRRPERILEILHEIGADIVLLQEADRRFGDRQSAIPLHMLAEHSRYRPIPYEMRPGSMGWHGNAVLIGADVDVIRHQPVHLPSLEPRGAVLADVKIRDQALRLVGMHLDLSGLWRRKQARAILTELNHQPHRLPVLLAGDLNEWRNAGCIRDFCQHHSPHSLWTYLPCAPAGRQARPDVRQRGDRGARVGRSPLVADAQCVGSPANLGENTDRIISAVRILPFIPRTAAPS